MSLSAVRDQLRGGCARQRRRTEIRFRQHGGHLRHLVNARRRQRPASPVEWRLRHLCRLEPLARVSPCFAIGIPRPVLALVASAYLAHLPAPLTTRSSHDRTRAEPTAQPSGTQCRRARRSAQSARRRGRRLGTDTRHAPARSGPRCRMDPGERRAGSRLRGCRNPCLSVGDRTGARPRRSGLKGTGGVDHPERGARQDL